MSPQTGSRIEYLIPTGNILVLLLYSNSIKASSIIGRFLMRQIDNEHWNNVNLFAENDYNAQMLEVHSTGHVCPKLL